MSDKNFLWSKKQIYYSCKKYKHYNFLFIYFNSVLLNAFQCSEVFVALGSTKPSSSSRIPMKNNVSSKHTCADTQSAPYFHDHPNSKWAQGSQLHLLLVFPIGHFLYFLPVWVKPPLPASCLQPPPPSHLSPFPFLISVST